MTITNQEMAASRLDIYCQIIRISAGIPLISLFHRVSFDPGLDFYRRLFIAAIFIRLVQRNNVRTTDRRFKTLVLLIEYRYVSPDRS